MHDEALHVVYKHIVHFVVSTLNALEITQKSCCMLPDKFFFKEDTSHAKLTNRWGM